MPGPGRLIKALMDLFPGLGPAMNRAAGVEKLMSSVADFREVQHRVAVTADGADLAADLRRAAAPGSQAYGGRRGR